MKSPLLAVVCAFCLLAYQPVSADLLDGQIRSTSNPSFTPAGSTSDLRLYQNVLLKPAGTPHAVPAPQALFLLGGGLLGLVGLAMGLVGLAKRKKTWLKRTCDPIGSLIRAWVNPGVYQQAKKRPVRGVRTMITGRTARIIIVDDHPVVRAGLRKLISDEPDFLVAGEAASVQEGMRLLDSTAPDAAIIDIVLPDGSGLDLVKSIHNRAPDIRILVVSMHDESMFAERAVRAGAMGYINQEEAPDKVVKALRQLLKGELYLSPAMTARLFRSVAGGNQPNRWKPTQIDGFAVEQPHQPRTGSL